MITGYLDDPLNVLIGKCHFLQYQIIAQDMELSADVCDIDNSVHVLIQRMK